MSPIWLALFAHRRGEHSPTTSSSYTTSTTSSLSSASLNSTSSASGSSSTPPASPTSSSKTDTVTPGQTRAESTSNPSFPSSSPLNSSSSTPTPPIPASETPSPSTSMSIVASVSSTLPASVLPTHKPRRIELVEITVPSVLIPLALLAVVAFLLVRRKRRNFMKAPSYQARVQGFTPPTSMRSRSQDALMIASTHRQHSDESHENNTPDSKMSSAAPSVLTASAVVGSASHMPWHQDPLPPTPDSDRSHARSPSLSERRSQRLQRALQDTPPSPMPGLAV